MSETFVRTGMLPEREPPASSVGALGWARTNLFSGWFNTVLTLLSVIFIVWLLSGVVPWLVSSTWRAASLGECREILAELGREGHYAGACWGVIRERWLQLTFGFYPAELHWRPILAFLLLLCAVAPVLFPKVPRRMLLLSAAYPFLMPWLLWGGPIWMPIMVAVGLAAAATVFSRVSDSSGGLWGIAAGLLVFFAWFFDPVGWILSPVDWIAGAGAGAAWSGLGLLPLNGLLVDGLAAVADIGLEPVVSREFGGFMLAVTIGVVAIGCSLPLGIVLALGRQSDLFIVKTICVMFIEFIRGVPLITLLFVASTLLNIFLPPGTEFDIIVRVMIMVTLFASAYMAEVIRGGLAALPRGQYEAADALGLDYWKAQRLIIMPQALKISIPGIVSTFIGVFKDTTLVSIIGLLDPLGLSNSIRADTAWNGIFWELYGFTALVFFIFCFSMSRYSMWLERQLQTDHR